MLSPRPFAENIPLGSRLRLRFLNVTRFDRGKSDMISTGGRILRRSRNPRRSDRWRGSESRPPSRGWGRLSVDSAGLLGASATKPFLDSISFTRVVIVLQARVWLSVSQRLSGGLCKGFEFEFEFEDDQLPCRVVYLGYQGLSLLRSKTITHYCQGLAPTGVVDSIGRRDSCRAASTAFAIGLFIPLRQPGCSIPQFFRSRFPQNPLA
jgi:hypothetical protein